MGQRGETGGSVNKVGDAYDLKPLVGNLHSGERELPMQKVYKVYDSLIEAIAPQ